MALSPAYIAPGPDSHASSGSMSPELMAKYFGDPEHLPANINPALLKYGMVATYSPLLTATSQAVFQHTFILALVFALRGFNLRRVWDLHYLSVLFTISIIVAPFTFLYDTKLDRLKLLFFQEHEAIEALILIRVVAPKMVAKHPGVIMLGLYTVLGILAVFVAVDDSFRHSVDIVLWTAYCSDMAVGVAGAFLARRWAQERKAMRNKSRLVRRKFNAESVWSCGLMIHGFTTANLLGPVWILVVYYDYNLLWWGYAWAAIWACSFFVVAFGLPTAALFFSNIWCCCGSRKKVFAGEAGWRGNADNDGESAQKVLEWPAKLELDNAVEY